MAKPHRWIAVLRREQRGKHYQIRVDHDQRTEAIVGAFLRWVDRGFPGWPTVLYIETNNGEHPQEIVNPPVPSDAIDQRTRKVRKQQRMFFTGPHSPPYAVPAPYRWRS